MPHVYRCACACVVMIMPHGAPAVCCVCVPVSACVLCAAKPRNTGSKPKQEMASMREGENTTN